MGAAFFASEGSAFIDLFGYAASINNAVDVPVTAFSVGSMPVSGDQADMIAINAIKGVSDSEYLLSRGFWLLMAAGLAVLSGLSFAPRQAKKPARFKYSAYLEVLNRISGKLLLMILPSKSVKFAFLNAQIRQILTPKWALIVLFGIALSGLFLPFKETVMPMMWLVLIFLLSSQSGRWQSRTAKSFLSTVPVESNQQFMMALSAAVVLTFVMCLPSIVFILGSAQYSLLVDVLLLCLVIPSVIYALGKLTGSGTAARLLMLVAWYMYLNV
jgi:hypothetical protein